MRAECSVAAQKRRANFGRALEVRTLARTIVCPSGNAVNPKWATFAFDGLARWLVRRVERSARSGNVIYTVGLSGIIRDKEAVFV